MAAVQRWQQWLLRRQQPEEGAPGSAAATAADAAAQLGHARAGGSSDQTSALSSSGGPSAPPSAPGSIAGSGEWPKAGGGIKAPVGRSSLGMPSSAAGCSGPGSSSCSYAVEPGQDDSDGLYGADELTLRSAWRRTETWLAAYILAALLLAVCINIGVGASNNARRNRVQLASVTYPSPPPAPPGAWTSPPPSVPAVPPPLPAQPPPLPSAPPAVLPPLPPPPAPSLPTPSPAVPPTPAVKPADCDAAPAALARERFSNAAVFFPADSSHYAANIVPGAVLDAATGARYPSYYNGAVPANCIVRVEAVYTCAPNDEECNSNAEQAVLYCQAGCGNQRDCSNVAGMAGHPLALRACGLLSRAHPGCSSSGLSPAGLQQASALYKLNLCMAPPGMAASAPPPPLGALRRAA